MNTPELYRQLFGKDYEVPDYIKRDAEFAMPLASISGTMTSPLCHPL